MPYERFVPTNATPIDDLDAFENTSQPPQASLNRFIRTHSHDPPTSHHQAPLSQVEIPQYQIDPMNCTMVFNHVANCPVCKRLHKSEHNLSLHYCYFVGVMAVKKLKIACDNAFGHFVLDKFKSKIKLNSDPLSLTNSTLNWMTS